MEYTYNEVSRERMRVGKDPAKAEQAIFLLESMVLKPFEEKHREAYWEWRRADHELYNGAHYDEAYAKYDVSQLYHRDSTGACVQGEYWSVEDVQSVYAKNKNHLGGANVYDLYVALNREYHEKIMLYNKWADGDTEKAQEMVIESAISFYFSDGNEDYNGKVWRYNKIK